MAASEHPMQALAGFLPEGSFEPVVEYIHHYKVHLTISRKRKSVLGDYRHAGWGGNHRISVNGDLNKYEFLITLLHELAHLLNYEQHRNRAEAHGKEWQANYSRLLLDFVQRKLFPPDIEQALQKSILRPSATANGETELLLVLRKYGPPKKQGWEPLIDLPEGTLFLAEGGRVFRKGPLRRKRFECIEIKTGHRYTFSAIAEVRRMSEV